VVLTAKDINWTEKVIYGMIALRARKCEPVSVGMRLIAEELGCGKSTVARSVANLVKFGHMIRVDARRGQRARYEFASWVFKHVDRRGDGEVRVTGYSGVPAHVGVVPEPVSQPRIPKSLRKQTA